MGKNLYISQESKVYVFETRSSRMTTSNHMPVNLSLLASHHLTLKNHLLALALATEETSKELHPTLRIALVGNSGTLLSRESGLSSRPGTSAAGGSGWTIAWTRTAGARTTAWTRRARRTSWTAGWVGNTGRTSGASGTRATSACSQGRRTATREATWESACGSWNTWGGSLGV